MSYRAVVIGGRRLSQCESIHVLFISYLNGATVDMSINPHNESSSKDTNTHAHAHTNTCTHTLTEIHTDIHTQICTLTYMHAYTHIHSHAHTPFVSAQHNKKTTAHGTKREKMPQAYSVSLLSTRAGDGDTPTLSHHPGIPCVKCQSNPIQKAQFRDQTCKVNCVCVYLKK